MGSMHILITPVILLSIQRANNILVRCDSFVLDPTYIAAPANFVNRPPRQFLDNTQFPVVNRNSMGVPRQAVLHTNTAGAQPKPTSRERNSTPNNLTFSDLINAFNELAENEETEHARAFSRDYEYTPYAYRPQPYVYPPRPNYGQSVPPAYTSQHEASYPLPSPPPAAPLSHHSLSKISLLKPGLDLVKPVTGKVASKVSGLVGLILGLLTGSSADDTELKGFKDIVINGIVKPLLLAKGGIKMLISKLTIPLIALLLINLEVLVTVWWLWEDCPAPVPVPPPYPYPKPAYKYNQYY
ncbi:uncharacterized protein LOC116412990 [Galleria mellonella]|uniref:Uncharacterized protein LOC116412990 n=1 Tax=Galleria mellonella TaxID=7137 RepID=A0A6J3C338_GALME|nr:uncharacterized protein LOC116412990 [Galleria mellonella]